MIIHKSFNELISLENLFNCWQEFRKDKKKKQDVMEFERDLEDNIFKLRDELSSGAYYHGSYRTFHIYDPKHRVISKASVRDRLIHHVVFKELYRIFDSTFISHSYSSRLGKGTHLAVRNVAKCLRKSSHNYTRPAHVLKCDIKNFFGSVDHQKLLMMIKNKIKDDKFLWLIHEIISSFASVDKTSRGGVKGIKFLDKGLPIGNVTSQIFANIYLDELDQFVKHRLKVKHYFRYADDFVVVHWDQRYLESTLTQIQDFLKEELSLELHPQKVSIRKFRQGVDFLGYVILPHHIVLRTKTRRRMFKKLRQRMDLYERGLISGASFNQSLQSYLGILSHCNGCELYNILKNNFKIGDIGQFNI